ncbi:MAG: hypothetical protein AAF456_24780, partial [Planctomycetota bacterium]
MIDDYSADTNTTGFYSVLAPPIYGINEDGSDHDWFRIPNLLRFYEYDIRVFRSQDDNYKQFGVFEMFDGAGNTIGGSRGAYVPDSYLYQHFRPSNRNHFFSIGGGVGGYRLYISVFDRGADTPSGAEPLNFRTRAFKASAIEETGDVDFYSYRLYQGIEYSIDVLGAASNSMSGTTLGNPQISVYTDAGQLIAEDLSSGAGTNARVTFTVDDTDDYYLRVRGAADTTGSYILQSDQFDDLPHDITTPAVLPTDGTLVGGQSNFNYDIDYYRVELDEGVLYQFTATAGLALFDETGERLNPNYGSTAREFTYRRSPNESSTFFVSTVSRFDYEISAIAIDDFGTGANSGTWDFSQRVRTGAIETPGDRDWFRALLQTWGRYDFEIVGFGDNPVDIPALSIRSTQDNSVIEDFGRQPGFFVPQNDVSLPAYYYIDARSNDVNATGVYRVTFAPGDHATGNASTLWNVDMSTGVGRIRNAFEAEDDVDWHRVNLKADTWYEIRQFSRIRQFNVVTPGGNVTTYDWGQRFIYSGDGGDHYLAMHSSTLYNPDNRSYEATIFEGAMREVKSGAFYSPSRSSGLSDATNLNPNRSVQVFSQTELRYEGVNGDIIIPAGQLTTLAYSEFSTLTPLQTFSGAGEVLIRGQLPGTDENGDSNHTAWAAIELYGRPRAEFLAPAAADEPPFDVSYAFAEGLPSYLSGDPAYGGFEALTDLEREAMETALKRWADADNGLRLTEFQPGSGNDAADTMIYKAAITSDVLAFRYGADIGGDIVLNTASPLWSDLGEGGEGFFQLLRAIGTTLGLQSTTQIGRHLSVMGDFSAGGIYDNLPYASYPTPMDIRAVRSDDNFFPHYGVQPGPTMFPLNAEPV